MRESRTGFGRALLCLTALSLAISSGSADAVPLKPAALKRLIAAGVKKPEQPPTLRDKWALIIGIQQFEDDDIDAIPSSNKNAASLAATLKDPQVGRFAADHVQVLTGEQATKGGVEQVLNEWLYKKALPNDMVVIYLSTRLALNKAGEPVLLFQDSKVKEAETAGTTVKQFLSDIKRRTQSPFVLCLLDTNPLTMLPPPPSHPAATEKPAAGAPPVPAPPKLDLTKITDPGAVVISANALSEPSYYNSKTGVSFFVQNINEALKSSNGLAPTSMLAQYLAQNVAENVERLLTKTQTPGLIAAADSPLGPIALGQPVKSSAPEPTVNFGHPVDKLALEHPELVAPRTGNALPLVPKPKTASPPAIAAKPPAAKAAAPKKTGGGNRFVNSTVEDEDDGVDTNLDMTGYMTKMKQDIQSKWKPPKGLESRRLVATFTIHNDGRITNASVVEGSGVPELDKSALEALQLASPLTPLPKGAPQSVDIRYKFDWLLKAN